MSIRTRSAAKSPASRSTGAPLMPLPPKSMPKGRSRGRHRCQSPRVERSRRNLGRTRRARGPALYKAHALVKLVYKPYGPVNPPLEAGSDDGRDRPAIANSTVPAGSTEQWRDRKRYLWLIGLVVPSLAFVGYGAVAADRLGRVVLDRPDRDPGGRARDRPGRRARPLQPARRRDRGAGEGPLLPLDHLPLPADPVRRVRRRDAG